VPCNARWRRQSIRSPFFCTLPAPTSVLTLSLHDALPIFGPERPALNALYQPTPPLDVAVLRREFFGPHESFPQPPAGAPVRIVRDRKSTRLNSSHLVTSYAVFCLKKKNPSCTCTAN